MKIFFIAFILMQSSLFADSTYLQEFGDGVMSTQRGQLIFGNGGGFEQCDVKDEEGKEYSILQVVSVGLCSLYNGVSGKQKEYIRL